MMTPEEITHRMMEKDAFSQWLGIKVEEVSLGYAKLKMIVREEMVNGFHIAHGGITYALADSALAFASNSYGNVAVSIETSISHLYPVKVIDELTAVATEISKSNKIGTYQVEISNQNNKVVAHFKGTVYFK